MNSLLQRIVVFITIILILGAAFVSVPAGRDFDVNLIVQRVAVQKEIGRSVLATIEKALANDEPYTQLVEVEGYLEIVNRDNEDADYIVLADVDGKILYTSDFTRLADGDTLRPLLEAMDLRRDSQEIGAYFNMSTPIERDGQRIGFMHIGAQANFIELILRDIVLEITTVLIVAILVAFQLLGALLASSFSTPIKIITEMFEKVRVGHLRTYLQPIFVGDINRLNLQINATLDRVNELARAVGKSDRALPANVEFDLETKRPYLRYESAENIRWPFFLVIFSESLSLSFFPIFVGQFDGSAFGLPHSIMVGLPITMFMLVWTISMPYAGAWCDKIGYRATFAVGASITTMGLILTAFATGMGDLLVWRSLTAIGYGVVYVTTQSYMIRNSPAAERTRWQAMFLTSFFAGSLSGAAIGGILVDRLGYQITFLLSGSLSLISALYAIRFLAPRSGAIVGKPSPFTKLGQVMRNREFAIITIFSAIPAKIALAGFLYYSIPLYFKNMGYSQSLAGSVMMAYGLAIILVGPIAARLADQKRDRLQFVVVGGYIASIAMMIPVLFDGTIGAVLAVIGLGIGHATAVAAQMTLINDRCGGMLEEVGQAATVGIFRLVERTGSIVGPIIFGALITFSAYTNTFIIMAVMSFLSVSAVALMLSSGAKRQGRV